MLSLLMHRFCRPIHHSALSCRDLGLKQELSKFYLGHVGCFFSIPGPKIIDFSGQVSYIYDLLGQEDLLSKLRKKIRFIGRKEELKYIQKVAELGEAAILAVYGRRRVGKTDLIEYALHARNLLKLEGVEDGNTEAQMVRVLYQLSKALNDFMWLIPFVYAKSSHPFESSL